MHNFKVGDRVRLVALDPELDPDGREYWGPFIGKTGTVVRDDPHSVYIEVQLGTNNSYETIFPAKPNEIEKV